MGNPWNVYVDEAQVLTPDQVAQLAHGIVDAEIATACLMIFVTSYSRVAPHS